MIKFYSSYTNYSGYSLYLFYVFIEQRFECFEGSVVAILAFDDGFVIVFLAFWIEGLGECGTAARQQSFAQAVSNDIYTTDLWVNMQTYSPLGYTHFYSYKIVFVKLQCKKCCKILLLSRCDENKNLLAVKLHVLITNELYDFQNEKLMQTS